MDTIKIRDFVSQIVEYGNEIRAMKEDDPEKEDSFLTLIGYAEALSVLQDICTEEEAKEIGLDFDVDNWLCSNGKE